MSKRDANLIAVFGILFSLVMDGLSVWIIILYYRQDPTSNIIFGLAILCLSMATITMCIYIWGKAHRGWK